MKKKLFIIGVILVPFLHSCRSIRHLSDKDHSNTAATVKPAKKKKTEFLEDIEVTPGAAVTTKHRTSASSTKRKNAESSSGNPVVSPKATTTIGLQDASYLQLKYSVLLGVSVDKLHNVGLLETIDKWWGTKYCMGGSTENCLDCSAFTQILLRDVYNINLPRTAQEQYNASAEVKNEDLTEGDLVFFHTSGRKGRGITHVGVYLQNNKFVHAATSGGVMISDLNEKYWQPKYKGAGRML